MSRAFSMDVRRSNAARSARLVEYFLEVVADPVDAATVRDSEECFQRRIERRFPEVDRDDFPLPDGVPFVRYFRLELLFCIPECLSAWNPSVYERKPTFFSFSLTGGDGARAYGFALHAYEEYTSANADWRPRVYCVISRRPFFSLFKEIVSWVYRTRTQQSEQRDANDLVADASERRSWFLSPRSRTKIVRRMHVLERSTSVQADDGATAVTAAELVAGWDGPTPRDLVIDVLNELVQQATSPSPGCALHLTLHGDDFFTYHLQRGNAPHLDDYCFQILFQCLSTHTILYVLNCMLLEQRVLLHSNHHGLLTPVCEALCALLFPFVWEHVYIPFLPLKLIDYLQAPVPYLIGVHTSSLTTSVGAEIFSSCVVVHLDKDKVVTPISSRLDDTPLDFVLARLPTKPVELLLRMVADVVPQPLRVAAAAAPASPSIPSPVSAATPRTMMRSLSERPTTEHEIEFSFGDGPLGITFESTHLRLLAVNNFEPGHHQPGASAVVKALPRLQNGLPGPAERSGLIAPGSFLVGINGESTLDLSFDETIDRLRTAPRPVRLRFLSAEAPHENACRFAQRLQMLSFVSARQVDRANAMLPWVDTVRGAFAMLMASLLFDYERFLRFVPTDTSRTTRRSSGNQDAAELSASSPFANSLSLAEVRANSSAARRMNLRVSFDHEAFSAAASAAATRSFLREFTQTQCFAGFLNDSVLGRILQPDAFPQMELFCNCLYLMRELGDATSAALLLLFERDPTVTTRLELALPSQPLPSPSPSPRKSIGRSDLRNAASASTSSSASATIAPAPMSAPSSTPMRRPSTTRQLEMLICSAVPQRAAMTTLEQVGDLDEIAPIRKDKAMEMEMEARLPLSLPLPLPLPLALLTRDRGGTESTASTPSVADADMSKEKGWEVVGPEDVSEVEDEDERERHAVEPQQA